MALKHNGLTMNVLLWTFISLGVQQVRSYLAPKQSVTLNFSELDSNGDIVRWGYCLEDCPSEEIRVACLDEPLFPILVEDDGYYQNSTSSYVAGSGQVTLEFDYVTYKCPEGYAFEDSTNATNYAICYDWEYVYPFDLTKPCVRKYNMQFIFFLSMNIH